MAQMGPGIACIGIIGRHNNPLHIALFSEAGSDQSRDELEFSLLLSSSLDVFDARMSVKSVGQDLGLLQAIDERLAMYGWLTNTGVKFVVVVDMEARRLPQPGKTNAITGMRASDLQPAFRAIQAAYINLFKNPFFVPDALLPPQQTAHERMKTNEITSPRFIGEIDRIGRTWVASA